MIKFTIFPEITNPKEIYLGVKGKEIEVQGLQEIHDVISQYSWSPFVFKNAIRKKENFLSTNLMTLDLDKDLSILKAIERLERLKLSYSITLTRNHQKVKNEGTPSEQPACDRFRIVIPLIREVTSESDYKDHVKFFQFYFPEMDKNCTDVARLYFNSQKERI